MGGRLRAVVVGFVLVGAWAAAGTSQAANVDLGARYDGHTANYSYIASVFVAHRLAGKSRFDIGYTHGRCSDGGRYGGDDLTLGRQGFRIKPDGTATFHGFYPRAFYFTKHGRKVWGYERFTIRFRFAGDRVDGVLTDRFVSPTLRCRTGSLHLTAWRDGTPEAPLSNQYATTGRYAGRSNFGDSMTMDVFVPLGLITKLHIKYRHGLFCSGALRPGRSPTFTAFDVTMAGGRFSLRGHYAYTDRFGVRWREHWSLIGNPIADPVWSLVVTAHRGRRWLGTCRTAPAGGDQFHLIPPP